MTPSAAPRTAPIDSQIIVKTCPSCGPPFTLRDLISLPEIAPLGMQFETGDPDSNVFYFNHNRPGCGSTFVVPVMEFLPLITEPIPDSILTGSEKCGHHCLSIDDLSICQAPCKYAPFRRFLVGIRMRTAAPLPRLQSVTPGSE